MNKKKLQSRERSLFKAVSFRIWATLLTMVIVYFFTGELALMAGIGIADFVSKIFLFYAHERLWEKIGFGKEKSTISST